MYMTCAAGRSSRDSDSDSDSDSNRAGAGAGDGDEEDEGGEKRQHDGNTKGTTSTST